MNFFEDPVTLSIIASALGLVLLITTLLFIRERKLTNKCRNQITQLAHTLEQSLLPNTSSPLEIPPLEKDLAVLTPPINQLLATHANQEHDRYQVLKELAQGLNHNMNNLLFGILGAAQLIERHSDDSEIQSWAQVAYTDGKKLTDLVKQLTEAVTEQFDPTPDDIDLTATIETLLSDNQQGWLKTAAANNQQIRFRTELAHPCALIRSNPSSIAKMIEQLLQNAVDALRADGTITVRTFQPNPLEVAIEVRDDGIGMTGETRRRIFDPFFTTKKALGTGLGLSKVMTIVLQWEGTVAVTSEAGKGTSFVVTFPAIDSPTEAPVDENPAVQHARVLVVDDQEAIGALIASALNDNFDVTVFQDAESAIRAFQPGLWEVAMIDLDLPGTSGDQLANRLGEHDP
ncbi:MAG: hypothetical protein DRQ54_10270, partial [Gammaproteobacteria bacterium]